MSRITIQVDDEFVEKLAAAIARQQLGGEVVETMFPPASDTATTWPQAPAEDDPWGAPASPPATATAPPGYSPPQQAAQPGPAQQSGPRRFPRETAKGTQWITVGLPDAPACSCGQGAAMVEGATNGKPWKRWACAKGSGQDWRNKCDFSQFTR